MEDDKEKLLLARLTDLADWVRLHHQPRSTFFLDPAETAAAGRFLTREAPDLRFTTYGGYPEAERRVVFITPPYLDPESEMATNPPLAARRLVWPARYYKLNHRDVLGAILGLGLKREQVGDILIAEGTAQVLLLKDIAPYVEAHLKAAGRAPVTVEDLALAELKPPQRQIKEIHASVASPRLDSVLAAAFGLSRSKAVPLIESERVQVNFEPVTDPDFQVPPGALLSVRGLGRARLVELGGTTKKGRTVAILERYL